jgi:hypothetical protein
VLLATTATRVQPTPPSPRPQGETKREPAPTERLHPLDRAIARLMDGASEDEAFAGVGRHVDRRV